MFTRGVWEQCPDEELLDIVNDAKEPDEILHRTEDYILERQETEEIDNYTMAVTFVQKVYQSPKKSWTLKKAVMIAIPVVLILGGISLGLFLRYRSIRAKEQKLEEYMESGETYLRYDNYQRAAEEYGEAKKLAEQILLADESLLAGEYEKAQGLYLTAREMSGEAGNVGKGYIESQLDRAKDYIEVYDLIALGERKEEYGNLPGAISAYKEAKEKAADLYDSQGKAEALGKQAAAEEKLEKSQMEEEAKRKEQEGEAAAQVAKEQAESEASRELENQQKANDQQNAVELENKGNELMAQGMYESAVTFYQTAQAIYIRLELPELADGLNRKIEAARAGIEAETIQKATQAAIQEVQGTEAEPEQMEGTTEYGPGVGLQQP